MPSSREFSYPGSLEKERFYGRREAIERLERLARDLKRGWGRSVHLWAPPGTGKTELLKQFYGNLFNDGVVFPFYYSFPGVEWELRDFVVDFVESLARQYLSFIRRDTGWLKAVCFPQELLHALGEEGSDAGRLLGERYRYFLDHPSRRSPSLDAGLLPAVLAETAGVRMCVMLDDIHHLSSCRPRELARWPREGLMSRSAPVLLATRQGSGLIDIIDEGDVAGAAERWNLPSLDRKGAAQLFSGLLRMSGMEFPAELHDTVIRQAGRSPFYLESVVREMGDHLPAEERSFQRAYADSVCRGGIHRYWLDIMKGALPSFEIRMAALEIMNLLTLNEGALHSIENITGALMRSREEIAGAASALSRAGIVEIDCSKVALIDDTVLKDFIQGLYGQERGASDTFTAAAMVAAKTGDIAKAAREERQQENRRLLRTLMDAWSGQQVPKVLFHADDFSRRFRGLDDDELQRKMDAEKEKIILSRVISSASGLVGKASAPAPVKIDAVAWVMQEGANSSTIPVCWAVRVIAEDRIEEKDVTDFAVQVNRLAADGELDSRKVVKWLVAGEKGFSPEALDASAARRVLTSTTGQIRLIGRFVGTKMPDFPVAHKSAPGESPVLEFEITIPMVSETELVAAGAIEKLAEHLDFEPGEVGKIKMALVEACINAFEHSGLPDGKVKITVSVSGGSMVMKVANRGEAFSLDRLPAPGSPGGGEEFGKRGWGLSLIHELMDEVEFEPCSDGASLVMVKYLKGKELSGE